MTDKLVKLSDVEEMIKKKNTEFIGFNTPIAGALAEGIQIVLQELLQSLSSLPTQNEWVSVSIELPEEYINVLVLRTNPNVVTMGYYTESRGFIWSNGRGETHKVSGYHSITHWKPLPLPPTN